MSRAFVKDGSENLPSEELPERPVSDQPNYVTPAGLAMLRDKVESLRQEHARLKQAAQDFDRPRLAQIERDLRYFQAQLESAIEVEPSGENLDEVRFGASVETRDEDGRAHTFTIVGEDEADAAQGRVSWRSPLARALIGSRVGDTVTWNRPAGSTTLEIRAIRYPRQRG